MEPKYIACHRTTGICPYLYHELSCSIINCKWKGMSKCYITKNMKHIPFCSNHQQMEYIYCEKCYNCHHYLKICDTNDTIEKYKKFIKKQKKLENMIKYMPDSTDYNAAKLEFDAINQESILTLNNI